jgi:molybdate transport system regulatory protein
VESAQIHRLVDALRQTHQAGFMTRLTIRIDFEAGSMGPGKAALLEQVAKTGSIRKAALSLAMSYRQAWLLLQSLHETFGAPLVQTTAGGKRGGGTTLTMLGEEVVGAYRRIERATQRSTASEVRILAARAGGKGRANDNGPSHRKLSRRGK